MKPGDVILTFKTGYMSNIFLPGAFKHGITYIGLPAERRAAGVVATTQTPRLAANLRRGRIAGGYPADVVEGVAEGVIFNSIEKIVRSPMGRLAVLRPRLTVEERVRQLTTVFGFLGCGYDFRFDFNDAAFQCCTEVIYRSLNGLGPIRLPLTPRMGRQTLSADDLCRHVFKQEASPFGLVLLAVRDPSRPGGHARIVSGAEGLNALRALFEK